MEAATCPEPPIRQRPTRHPRGWQVGSGQAGQAEAKATISYIPKRSHGNRRLRLRDRGRSAAAGVNREQIRAAATRTDRSQAKQAAGQPGGQTGRQAQADRQLRACQAHSGRSGRQSDPEPSVTRQRRRRVRQRRRLPSEPQPRAQGGEEPEEVVSRSRRPRPRSGRLRPRGGRKRWEGAGPPGARATAPQRSPVSETFRATGVMSASLGR